MAYLVISSEGYLVRGVPSGWPRTWKTWKTWNSQGICKPQGIQGKLREFQCYSGNFVRMRNLCTFFAFFVEKKIKLKKGKKEEKIIIKKWEDRYGYKGRRRPYSKK